VRARWLGGERGEREIEKLERLISGFSSREWEQNLKMLVPIS
jgi:hypothetical protein